MYTISEDSASRSYKERSRIFERTGPKLDFEYCVILIYRLKESDRSGDVQVTFVYLKGFFGQCIFTIEKVLMEI